jgi:hypothetical protein
MVAGFIAFPFRSTEDSGSALSKTKLHYGPLKKAIRRRYSIIFTATRRAHPMSSMLMFPFKLLFSVAGGVLRIIGLIGSFGFRVVRFAVSRPILVLLAAIAGFFVGRKHLQDKPSTDRKNPEGNR